MKQHTRYYAGHTGMIGGLCMAIEVFNRYEKKYMLDEVTFKRLLNCISDYMEPDKYNKNGQFYSISNIYYDTDDNRLIRSSIEKPVYKEKLRMRSYGTPDMSDKVFLEIKKKYNGIVNKRRTSIVLEDAYRYMEQGIKPYETECLNRQVLSEIDYFRSIYELKPKVYLSYDRYAFFEKNDGDFRVTFDTNITTRRGDVRLESGSYGNRLLPQNLYLMEIKINGAVPMWFTRCLSELKIYPVSFSKYGTEYKRYVLEGYDKNTEMLDDCSMFYESSDKETKGYSYDNVIRYKNKHKPASEVYTDNEANAVCIW